MLQVECSNITYREVFTFGLAYTILNNKGILTINDKEISFEGKECGKRWNYPVSEIKKVSGLFFLVISFENGDKKILFCKRKNLKKIKKELKKFLILKPIAP